MSKVTTMNTKRPSPFALPSASVAALFGPSSAAIALAAAIAGTAAAQTAIPIQVPSRQAASPNASLPPPVTDSERRFRELSDYIRARGEIDAATRADIERVARDLDADLAKPGEPIPTVVRLLAARVQTAIWIDDRGARDSAFEKLVAFQSNKDATLLAWARERIACAEFEKALELLQNHQFGPGRAIDARILLATCLAANNRYDEAQAALNGAPTQQRTPDHLARIGALTDRISKLRELWNAEMVAMAADQRRGDLPVVEFVTPKGAITIELFEDQAPNTVGNFIEHVEAGTYNGTRFHRALRGFGVQGGDPDTATGGAGGTSTGGWTIPDETVSDAKRAPLLGRLIVASQPNPSSPTAPQPHSGGCQFMILINHAEQLQGMHTVFGRVTDGLDVVRVLTPDDELVSARVISKRDKEYKGVRFSTDAKGDFSMPLGGGMKTRVLETKVTRPNIPGAPGAPVAPGAPGGQPRLVPVQPPSGVPSRPPAAPGTPSGVPAPPPLLTPNGPPVTPK